MVAGWTMWWGGSCYGPCLLVPVIPALAVSLAIARRWLAARAWARPLFGLLAAFGLAIQRLAATTRSTPPGRSRWASC